MEYPYDIQDLSRIVKISKATIYSKIKKNQDFFKDNSRREKETNTKTKPKIKYNQVALDFLLAHYGSKGADESSETPLLEDASQEFAKAPSEQTEATKPQELSEKATKNDSNEKLDQTSIEALKAQISALEAKIEALEKELASKEGERKELLNQNGALLLLLSQEKQEKALLLPAPKKSIGERIKGFFSKS